MKSYNIKVLKPEDLALAGRDAVSPENCPPFLLVGLVLAILTNVLTAVIATVGYAYVSALWNRSRTEPGPK